jgi:hypothetical protein
MQYQPKLLHGCHSTTAIMASICTSVNTFHGRPDIVPGEFDVLSSGDTVSLHQKIHKHLGGVFQVKVVRISLQKLDAVLL